MDYGYYEPNYNFESSGHMGKKHLSDVNAQLKAMIQNVQHKADKASLSDECAGYITSVVTFNNSTAQGDKDAESIYQANPESFLMGSATDL